MTPKVEAIAFRAWQVASRMGWDCTIRDVAEEIGYDFRSLGNIVSQKGWKSRFRANQSQAHNENRSLLLSRGADNKALMVREFERETVARIAREGSISVGAP